MKKISLLLAIAFVSIVSFAQDKNEADIIKKGDALPTFTLDSSVYGKVDSKELKGKVVLISIFATWCGPCQSELAEVQSILWPKFKDNANFKLLVIGREHTEEQLKAYNKRKGFTFPLYPDPKREFTSKFATSMIPRIYLVDKEGKVVEATVGYSKQIMPILIKRIEEELNK